MKIVIPSYKRSEDMKVLDYLEKCEIDKDSIDIIVSNKEEQEAYQKANPGYNIVHIKDCENLKEKHNAITEYYEEGKRLVIIEDDIEKLVKKSRNKSTDFYHLKELIKIGFNECLKEGVKLWGIGPTDNGFYMANKKSKCYKVIAGYLFGVINDKSMIVGVSNKHDYERTILHQIKYGGAFRFDMIGQKSKSFTNKGGLQDQYSKEERAKAELTANAYLLKKYPKHVARRKRTNKTLEENTELRLLKIKE